MKDETETGLRVTGYALVLIPVAAAVRLYERVTNYVQKNQTEMQEDKNVE